MILAIGGRSKIGSALIDSLRARGEAVCALVQWHCNAVDAARDSGVGLVVRSSIIGADRDSPTEFIDAHTQCDRYLEESGLDYAILRPNLFLQNVRESTIPSIDADGRFYLDAGDARISMVDTRDVAAVASVMLTEAGHTGAHYEVSGPEALSYGDVASKLSAVLGRAISYVEVPDDAVRESLLGFGLDQWFVQALVASVVTDAVEQLTGATPRSLDDLLAESEPATGR